MVVLLCAGAGLSLGLWRVATAPALYHAQATLLLSSAGTSEINAGPGGGEDFSYLNITTEGEILASDTVLLRVAHDLNLANDARFSGFAEPGRVVDEHDPGVRAYLLRQMRGGLAVDFGQATLTETDTLTSNSQPVDSARVRRASAPHILYLNFYDQDAGLCAEILKDLIRVYRERSAELRVGALRQVTAHLNGALDDLHANVSRAEGLLLDLQRRDRVVGPEGADEAGMIEVLGLDRARNAARQRVRTARAADSRGGGLNGGWAAWEGGEARPTSLRAYLSDVRVTLAQARARQAELRTTLGEAHPEVRGAAAEVAGLEDGLAVADDLLRRESRSRVMFAEGEVTGVSAALVRENADLLAHRGRAMQAESLAFEVERDTQLYRVLTMFAQTATLDAGYGATLIDVLQEPEAPLRPIRRHYLQTAVVLAGEGAAVGLVVAILMVVLLNERARTVAQLERRLGLPAVAVLPMVAGGGEGDETFRDEVESLKHALMLAGGKPPQCILLTAAAVGQGKTTVAVALAEALGREGAAVLLVDADFHRPRLGEMLGLPGEPGLGDVLRGEAAFAEAVQGVGEGRAFDFMGIGRPIGGADLPDAELLDTMVMQTLVGEARARYEFVVFDHAAVPPVNDSVGVLRRMDAVLLVTRQEAAVDVSLRRVRDLLAGLGVRVVGFCLNAVAGRGDR